MSCNKCGKPSGYCICDLSSYTRVGKDISAIEFLKDYTTSNGSVFYQGWAYKHNQMKFKLNEKEIQIKKLESDNKKLIKALEFYANIDNWNTHIEDIEESEAECNSFIAKHDLELYGNGMDSEYIGGELARKALEGICG